MAIIANGRSRRQTVTLDYETRKPYMVVDGPLGLSMSVKQSKKVKFKPWEEVWMFMNSDTETKIIKPAMKTKAVIAAEPDISELIKDILEEKNSLHFSQVRSALKKRGVDVSRRVTGSILRLMTQTHQVQHDERMYYSLAKVS